MPGSNKNSDPNRKTTPSRDEESGMRGKPSGSRDEDEEELGGRKDSGNKGTDTRKGNSGNTDSSSGSSGGRSGGSSGPR